MKKIPLEYQIVSKTYIKPTYLHTNATVVTVVTFLTVVIVVTEVTPKPFFLSPKHFFNHKNFFFTKKNLFTKNSIKSSKDGKTKNVTKLKENRNVTKHKT